MKTRRRICRIKRIQVQKVKWPDVELNECRIKREGSVVYRARIHIVFPEGNGFR